MSAPKLPGAWALDELLSGLATVTAAQRCSVVDITDDSRQVVPGSLFFARRGHQVDATVFIDQAIAAGAAAVAVEAGSPATKRRYPIPVVVVPDLAGTIGLVADRFYQRPSRAMRTIGVTGTNGKTSVSHIIAQVMSEPPADGPRSRCGIIGTLGYGMYGDLRAAERTTPDAISVHRILAALRASGAGQVVMEVSSHGLDQGRVVGVEFETAVFTNLSRDHLDYHGDMQTYGLAKRRLFESPGLRHAVVNADDAFGRHILDTLPAPVEAIAFTLSDSAPPSDVRLVQGRILSAEAGGQHVSLRTPWGDGELTTGLLGRFNVANLLAALGTLVLHGVGFEAAVAGLARVPPLPGRMQRLGGEGTPLVVVDYAHSPDALRIALGALRAQYSGQLWCVVGCGGDRDQGKRPLMAAAAVAGADRVLFTQDNPRSEDPRAIIDQMLAGIPDPDQVWVELDRAAAISSAVRSAAADDVVLLAGKGHETCQEVAGVRRPFSDVAAARTALRGWTGGPR